MSETALSIKNLKKTYKGKVEALKGIDLEVKKGDFFALLGPNGAGKTTAINIIISLTNKTSGQVKVFNYDIDKELGKAKTCIGVVPQEFNFNIFEKVFDIVVHQAGYYGIGKKTASKRAEKYLKQLDLWEKRNATAQALSGGLKRRLMIVRALIHEPELLILDEPTAGVDIEIRRSMWKFISDLNTKGRTIILTTHYLEEAENLCRNIAIIDKGKIIENTSMKNLLSRMDKDTFIFDITTPIKKVPQLKDHKINILDPTTIEIEILKKQNLNRLFEHFKKNNIEILNMRRKTARLEELFMGLVNKK
ncbi:ABC transporter [Candidatus Woesearchaeota archaeon]|nr:ABC transporter [Candidatus Woesearchaeota archaeon]|tara:strand:- start:9961 stop:10878 length:918 start_codon:yes stop_codon:yes gene_type:complete